MGFIGEFSVPSVSHVLSFCTIRSGQERSYFFRLSLSVTFGVTKERLPVIILIVTVSPITIKMYILLLSNIVPTFP